MKIKGLRWYIVVLIAFATIINYIDRNAFAYMWPAIKNDLGLSETDYKFIITCFSFSYAISQALSGKLFDMVGTRLGFVFSIGLWSISAALHGFAKGVMSFSIVRTLLGLGEAGNWPGATKSNAEWFPAKERALAQGIFNAGASAGLIISPPLIAALFGWIGWKTTFMIIGVIGLVWIIPWLIINKNTPDKHKWITEEEKDLILEDKTATVVEDKGMSWGKILSIKQSWSVIVSRFLLDPIWWVFVYWLPDFLQTQFGFDIKQIGAFAWFPYVGAMIGGIAGGWLSGYLLKKGWSVNKARKTVIVIGCAIMLPALIATATVSNPYYSMVAIFFALFGFQWSMGVIQTLPSDFLNGKAVGSLSGLGGMSASLGVIVISIWVAPFFKTYSYAMFFYVAAALVPLGLLALYIFSGHIKKVELKN